MVEVLFTGEFESWWDGLTGEEQESVAYDVNILREQGVTLGFPRSSGVGVQQTLSHARTENPASRPAVSRFVCVRPKRAAILLIGGDKTGNNRWYEIFVPIADRLYDEHVAWMEE